MAPSLFIGLLQEGLSENLRFEAKISRETNENEIARYEQMVMYYPTTDHDRIIEFAAKFHDQWKNYFTDKVPEFVARVGHFETGEVLNGVGFGEEPGSGRSFGEVRASILADLYKEAQQQKMNVIDPRFRLGERFRIKCREYGVDPREPAFNLAA